MKRNRINIKCDSVWTLHSEHTSLPTLWRQIIHCYGRSRGLEDVWMKRGRSRSAPHQQMMRHDYPRPLAVNCLHRWTYHCYPSNHSQRFSFRLIRLTAIDIISFRNIRGMSMCLCLYNEDTSNTFFYLSIHVAAYTHWGTVGHKLLWSQTWVFK